MSWLGVAALRKWAVVYCASLCIRKFSSVDLMNGLPSSSIRGFVRSSFAELRLR
jgi:hypothetical protein